MTPRKPQGKPPTDLDTTDIFPAHDGQKPALPDKFGLDDTAEFLLPAHMKLGTPAAPPAKTSATSPPTPVPPTRPAERKVSRLGDFRLVKVLGKGSLGMLYQAQQISHPRLAALKVLFSHLAGRADALSRFQREARVLVRLDHPNLLRCLAAGEDQGWHYLAMEWLDGGNLEAWRRRLGRLAVGDAVHILLACARGLQHAHGLQQVHGGLKPENVLLTSRGVVKVADLGLSGVVAEDYSVAQSLPAAGMPLYLAPEQARPGQKVDGRSDIHALGCMLYHFLTGRPPFAGATVAAVLQAKEKGLFAPARQFLPELPPRLEVVLNKMLAWHPAQRYQTCAELIEELEWQGLANVRLSFLPAA
jgi:serine/threonine protein kinase